ncbi:MAG: ATP-grasp fold amidoligase family protein [Verrucomicrobiota bacterium]
MKRVRDAAFRLTINEAVGFAYRSQVKLFRQWVGYDPDVALPKRYHEKLFWRKLFDHNPDFVLFCDKLATKDYVAGMAPEVRIPKTFWSGEMIEAAPKELFSSPVVVKANHGSNYNYFWNGPGDDFGRLSVLTKKWMAEDYGDRYFEWGYYGVKKRLFVEELISSDEPDGLVEMNIRCSDGKAILGSVILHNKTERMQAGYVETDGSHPAWTDDSLPHARIPPDYTVPPCYHRAVEISKTLSAGCDYLRVDFMTDGKQLYAGEITVYPGAGLSPASPAGTKCCETIIEENWDLKKTWFLTSPQRGLKKAYASWLKGALDA